MTRPRVALMLLLMLSSPFAAGEAQTTIFVDDDATVPGDGQTWSTAFRFLKDALAAAQSTGATEIRVAQGLYVPDESAASPTGIGDPSLSFEVENGRTVRGGYLGLSALPGQDPDSRDVDAYVTVLSGDLEGDDGPNFANRVDNSFHVVVLTSSTLEGFRISGGHACGSTYFDEHGGGIFAMGLPTTIRLCHVIDNDAFLAGGCFVTGGVDVVECRFEENRAEIRGGAIEANFAVLTVQLSDFVRNDSFVTGFSTGGAIAGANSSDVVIQSCQFSENSTTGRGGAVDSETGTMELIDSVFFGNYSAHNGGAASTSNSELIITDCLFFENSVGWAAFSGGAINSQLSTLMVTRCQFLGNFAVNGGLGGAAGVSYSNAKFESCDFVRNSSEDAGGGAIVVGEEGAEFVHCRFHGNSASTWGGALLCYEGTAARLVNCEFVGNTAMDGGGLASIGGSIEVLLSTLHSNHAQRGGGVWLESGAELEVSNSILWSNSATLSAPDFGGVGLTAFTYSDVSQGALGPGVISSPPGFVSIPQPGSDGAWGTLDDAYGDLRLPSGSPCIDAGQNILVPSDLDLDLSEQPRRADDPTTPDTGSGAPPLVDMGAYERFDSYTMFIRADANLDGLIDIADGITVLSFITGGGAALPCRDASDMNDDGAMDIADPIYLFSYLFQDGVAPTHPFSSCGVDPTSDGLDCGSSPCP